MHNARELMLLCLLLSLIVPSLASAQQESAVSEAESTFTFISNTLQTFQRTGRLNDEIGLDGSEYQDFISLLQSSYAAFTREFSPESNFCSFYHDPENAIMEIEEKAALAFQSLTELTGRQQQYVRLNQQFERDVLQSYGGRVLDRIAQIKAASSSFEYLPARELDGAEIINFADTACR